MLQLFLTHLRGYKRQAVFSPILIVLEVICELILPLVMAEIVDTAIPGANPGRILAYILLFVSIPLLSGAARSYYTYITAIKCRV